MNIEFVVDGVIFRVWILPASRVALQNSRQNYRKKLNNMVFKRINSRQNDQVCKKKKNAHSVNNPKVYDGFYTIRRWSCTLIQKKRQHSMDFTSYLHFLHRRLLPKKANYPHLGSRQFLLKSYGRRNELTDLYAMSVSSMTRDLFTSS